MPGILKLRNEPVYNVITTEVYNKALLPGNLQISATSNSFDRWYFVRKASMQNNYAKNMCTHFLDIGKLVVSSTMTLSLIDSYWVAPDDSVAFENVTPYLVDFWKYDSAYVSGAAPTMFVSGDRDKYWTTAETLVKQASSAALEIECLHLLHEAGLDVVEADSPEFGVLHLTNFTSMDEMYEPARSSKAFHFKDTAGWAILYNVYGVDGVRMALSDLLLGLPWRGTDNHGFIKSTKTNEVLRKAPLFGYSRAGLIPMNDMRMSAIGSMIDQFHDLKDWFITLTEEAFDKSTSEDIRQSAREILRFLK